jgi:hypothetical protein
LSYAPGIDEAVSSIFLAMIWRPCARGESNT